MGQSGFRGLRWPDGLLARSATPVRARPPVPRRRRPGVKASHLVKSDGAGCQALSKITADLEHCILLSCINLEQLFGLYPHGHYSNCPSAFVNALPAGFRATRLASHQADSTPQDSAPVVRGNSAA